MDCCFIIRDSLFEFIFNMAEPLSKVVNAIKQDHLLKHDVVKSACPLN